MVIRDQIISSLKKIKYKNRRGLTLIPTYSGTCFPSRIEFDLEKFTNYINSNRYNGTRWNRNISRYYEYDCS